MTSQGTRSLHGVTSGDIFGKATGAEPATPGSYGRLPSGFRLPATTGLGPVRLRIADLGRSVDYYQQVLGLQVLRRSASAARLGTPAGTPLVELEEKRGAQPWPGRGRTGLFHFAVLLPDRAHLGRFARHLGDLGIAPGAADHLVSEALYLRDPDHLGIEVYADRPRSAWRRVGRELRMATDPLDLEGLLEASGDQPWEGAPTGTRMGHVHLHVGDLDRAAAFFSDGLGFDRTVWGYPGALFLGAGGYHHHLGTNLWAGPRATPPSRDEAQLLEWTIEMPSESSLAAAVASLQTEGSEVTWQEDAAQEETADLGLSAGTRDPWGTAIRLRVAAAERNRTGTGDEGSDDEATG